ncbi:homoserine dehydrogenase [Abyssibacter sp.]|uniref:homoserine dehydrogenase n=1 Tax=Abyssibacter sp. TaxID=2320200 RepID=UPI0025B851A9|nr:homoserine dehydrogenase [Abyssibacter sp.]MCK5859016.1 homoserine dehydrogenase [Abyssibacter sp.]
MNELKLGLLGLGTVGGGVLTLLERNGDAIANRAGLRIRVVAAAVRDAAKARPGAEDVRLTTSIDEVIDDPDVDVVLELMGGTDAAKTAVERAIRAGKPVVTANKALIALHGQTLFEQAKAQGTTVSYEAAVAGGIPLIKALREGLTANKIHSIAGIINGTCNYILTEMSQTGAAFDTVLADAQRLGYAEADPTFDVGGIDAAHKLTILASIAFGIPLSFDQVTTDGIGSVTAEDLTYARELGYRIKPLAIARRQSKGVELRVHPTLVPEKDLLANVNGVLNAVVVRADAASPTGYFGPGAGAEATASAVLADVVDLARNSTGVKMPALGQSEALPNPPRPLSIDDAVSAHYLRLRVADTPGVLNAISGALAEHAISIEAIVQKELPSPVSTTTVIILTQPVPERVAAAACAQIEALSAVSDTVHRIRVEHFDE